MSVHGFEKLVPGRPRSQVDRDVERVEVDCVTSDLSGVPFGVRSGVRDPVEIVEPMTGSVGQLRTGVYPFGQLADAGGYVVQQSVGALIARRLEHHGYGYGLFRRRIPAKLRG